MCPKDEAMKSRYKRLKLISVDDNLEKELKSMEDGLPFSSNLSEKEVNPAKIEKRRDTVEKNLDEMFSSDQETDLEMKEPRRKKQKTKDKSNENPDYINAPPSPILEPFYGFDEQKTSHEKIDSSGGYDRKFPMSQGSTNIENHLKVSPLPSSLLQVDLNGNTFGMTSVLASPISDFNSDIECDETIPRRHSIKTDNER